MSPKGTLRVPSMSLYSRPAETDLLRAASTVIGNRKRRAPRSCPRWRKPQANLTAGMSGQRAGAGIRLCKVSAIASRNTERADRQNLAGDVGNCHGSRCAGPPDLLIAEVDGDT